MSDKMRWKSGDTNPVVAAVDSETVIEIGDLLWQDVDDARPASLIAGPDPERAASDFNSYKEALLSYFAQKFLGVAMQYSRKGDTAPVRVATTSVFEFDCPSSTFELGDFMGVYISANFSLFNRQMAKVGNVDFAIGRIAKREANPTTSVLVDIRSTVMTGGVR